MADKLPPIPYKSDFLTRANRLTNVWAKFIKELFYRAQDYQDRLEALEQEPS